MAILNLKREKDVKHAIDGIEYEPALTKKEIQEQGSFFLISFAVTPYLFVILIFFGILDIMFLGLVSTSVLMGEVAVYMWYSNHLHSLLASRQYILSYTRIGYSEVKEEVIVSDVYTIAVPEAVVELVKDNQELVANANAQSEDLTVTVSLTPEVKRALGYNEDTNVNVNLPAPFVSIIAPLLTRGFYLYLVRSQNGMWRYYITPYQWNDMFMFKDQMVKNGIIVNMQATAMFATWVGHIYAPQAVDEDDASGTGKLVPVFIVDYSIADHVKGHKIALPTGEERINLDELLHLASSVDAWYSHTLHARLVEANRQLNVYKEQLKMREVNQHEVSEKIAQQIIKWFTKGAGSIISQYRTRLESFLIDWGLPIIAALSTIVVLETLMILLGMV